MSIDIEAFNHLLQLLSTLKKDVDMDDVLSNGTLWKFLPVASLKETVYRISTIDSVLQALSTGMRKSTAALELLASNAVEDLSTPCFRKCQGLLSLPNELLCIIAKEIPRIPSPLYEKARPSRFLPFSQTCRRVREATLLFPALWTTISTTYTSSQVEAFLSRSQDLPLVVKVDIPRSQHPDLVPPLRAFVNQVLRHSHRWRTLHLSLDDFVPDSREVRLLGYLGDSVGMLPALEFLSIGLSYSFEDDEALYESDDFHFYKSWMMPVLRTFAFRNFIPRAVLPRTVTSVEAAFGSRITHGRNPSLLLHFLQSIPQIENLKLDLPNRSGDFDFGSPLILDTVKSLDVMCGSHSDDNDEYATLHSLMHHLVLPNLEKVKVLASVREWHELGLCIDSLFAGQNQLEKVNSFVLKVVRLAEEESCYAGALFEKVPNLKDLTVDAYNVYPPGLWGYDCRGIPPNLRSVRLKLGGDFDGGSIFRILDETKIQSLEFTHVTSFIQSKIQDRIGETKLTWKEELDPQSKQEEEEEAACKRMLHDEAVKTL